MIQFRERRLVIEVETTSPEETLNQYVKSLLTVMRLAMSGNDKVDTEAFYFLIDLLEECTTEIKNPRFSNEDALDKTNP